MSDDGKRAWVVQVLGIDPGPSGSTQAVGQEADGAGLEARLRAAVVAARALHDAAAPEAPDLLARCTTLLKGYKTSPAGIAGPLEALEADLARAASAARGRAAAPPSGQGVAYRKLLLRWREAQGNSTAALAGIGKALLAMPEVRADHRFARVQKAVAKLPDLMPQLGSDLEDLLDRGVNAGSNAGIASEALNSVGAYRRKLGAATALSKFEAFARQHVGDLAVIGTLDGALAEIEQNLKSAQ